MNHQKTNRSLILRFLSDNRLFCLGLTFAVLLVTGLIWLAYPPKTHPLTLAVEPLPPHSVELLLFQGGVEVNGADLATLATLPGIGEKVAEAWLVDRAQYGPYYFPEDILSVKGIGKGKLKHIRDLVTLPTAAPFTHQPTLVTLQPLNP